MVTETTEYVVDMSYKFCDKFMRCRLSFDKLSEARKYASSLRNQYHPDFIEIFVKVLGSDKDF